jgi:hypothetical protein
MIRIIGFISVCLMRAGQTLAPRRSIDGLSVRQLPFLGRAGDPAYEKLCAAVRLINTHDPACFARMRRDFSMINLEPLPSALGQYFRPRKVCSINYYYCDRSTVSEAEVAGVIVHEAMHARLDHLGFVTSESNRVRVERICVKAELLFASRLTGVPSAVRVKKNANARLRMLSDRPDSYTTEARLDQDLAAITKAGAAPQWFLRMMRSSRSAR